MPIQFNFNPAGLAAVLAGTAGEYQGQEEAYGRARQSQQDSIDNFLRMQELQGRMSSLFNEQQHRQDQFDYQKKHDADQMAFEQSQQNDLITQRMQANREAELRRIDMEERDKANAAGAADKEKRIAAQQKTMNNLRERRFAADVGESNAKLLRADQHFQASQKSKTETSQERAVRMAKDNKVKTLAQEIAQVQRELQSLGPYAGEDEKKPLLDHLEQSRNDWKAAAEDYQTYLNGQAAADTAGTQPAGGQLPAGAVMNPDGTMTYNGTIYRKK